MRRGLLLAAVWLLLLPLPLRAAETLTVFAAASLKTALDEVARDYGAKTGVAVSLSYAGSSALARQIQYGAPAQVFISANAAWMDDLEARGLLAPGTRRNLLSNRLVLIAPAGSATRLNLVPGADLAGALGNGRLAMALVEAVPAGIYGREALVRLGLWDSVSDRIAQADNVRAALRLVALGEAPLGIVYATDALPEPRVAVLSEIDPALHAAIVYPAAILREGDSAPARAFLAYLGGPEAGAVFLRHGFRLAEPPR